MCMIHIKREILFLCILLNEGAIIFYQKGAVCFWWDFLSRRQRGDQKEGSEKVAISDHKQTTRSL